MKRALSILLVLAIALLFVVPRVLAAPTASDELGDDGDQTLIYYGSINAELNDVVHEHEIADFEMAVGLAGDNYER